MSPISVNAISSRLSALENLSGRTRAGILVPFYIYPNNPYSDAVCQRLFEALRTHPSVPAVVIINPSSGPGTVTDGNYTAFIRLAKAAGAQVIGYISTDFGVRPEEDVIEDMNTWLDLYPSIDGIFLDEQPYETGPGNTGTDYVDMYKRFTDYAHSKYLHPVVSNQGSAAQAAWFDVHSADITVIHENTSWPSLASNWIGGNVDYTSDRRAVLVYNQSTLSIENLNTAIKYCRWIYVTNDNLTGGLLNPWDELPTYLEDLFAALDDAYTNLSNVSDAVVARGNLKIFTLTQSEYDALDPKDPDAIYLVS